MKRLLLIDGNNLLFRSYYATAASGNLMQNSQGVYTNGIYGFVMAIESILKMEFTHLMVALDAPGKTLRHERYPEYKGTRKETPEPLVMQFPLMKEYLVAANITHQEKQPYEADDLIGYACSHFKDYFSEILIISNDHDLMQLIDENVHQLVSKKGLSEAKRYTMDVMKEELGIRPDQMPDYKGLCGDPSDNIPGVPGIGDKTAVKLLQEYDTLENVLSHAEEMKGKLRERLLEFKDQARFSKELATIAVDFPYELKPDDLVYHEPEVDQMVAFYQKMEFQSFIRRLQNKKKPVQPVMIHVATIEDDEAIKRILTSPMAIHLELYGTNYHTAQKLGIALVGAKGSGFVPYRIFQKSRILQAWFEDADAHKYVFDAKQLQVALMWDRFVVKGIVFDLKLSAYLVNPNLTREDFRGVSGNFSADVPDDDEAIYGKGAKYQLPDDEIYISHALKKAQTIYRLKTDLSEKNQAFGQDRLLQEIELPLSEVLAQMEYLGIMVSEPILDEFGSDLMRRIETLTSEIHELSGQDFNINSPKQLGTVLFESLGLPYQKRGKTGYSTDISVLNQLRGFHPVIDKIIVYRTLTKLYGTYYEGLKTALKLKDDGRIHTIYKQTLTQTGRLSSVDPNLQNIPIRTEEGRELRKVFISDPGHVLLSADYSQIELRVLAELADVRNLKEAFIQGEDVHVRTAQLIFHKTDISPLERRQAKAINFGIIYGKTAWGLAEDLQISPKQAERFIQNYFASYPEIRTYMDLTIQEATERGYVETLFHRRRYIPELNASQYQVREFGKRMAMNAPIQGSAADILKVAMVRLENSIRQKRFQSKILLQIHDELVLLVPLSELDEMRELLKVEMEHAVPTEVPLVAEVHWGSDLFEVKDHA